MIDIGDSLPELSASATSGETVTPASLKGQAVVLYFYPKDSTPGCTREGQDFRDRYDRFQAAGARIYGVSRDSLKSHENFRTRQSFPFQLIADTDEQLCRLFGVIKEKNMYGRKVMGIERSTFLIDREGRLRRAWRGVKVPGHADAVLEALTSL